MFECRDCADALMEIGELKAKVKKLEEQAASLKGENAHLRMDKKRLQDIYAEYRYESISQHNDLVMQFKLDEFRLREKIKELENRGSV